MNIHQIETPALILDEKKFKQNAKTMKNLLSGTNLALRPHYKSHKCSTIAHMQIQGGAKGMTCAKLSEALDLVDSGIEDVLIANQITDPVKIRRLADLAGNCHLTVCVDDLNNIKQLALAAENAGTTIHCLIEYDIGMERCGVTSQEDVVKLAEAIGSENHLHFDGVQAYAGHISHIEKLDEREKKTADNSKKLRNLLALLESKNMPAKILSGGSTGTAQIKASEGLYNELQAGSYLFMDSTYSTLNLPFDNSLFLLSSVVSSRDGLTVIDSGVKTCGMDQGFPRILDNKAQEIVASEEHFQLHKLKTPLNIGDKILLIPGHCCSTVNLHDKIYVVDNDKVIDRLLITGRGIGK